MSVENNKGIIGEYYENELPVIVKFVNELPAQEIRSKFTILTVISWKYNGCNNNGMPEDEINLKMVSLESAIENSDNNNSNYTHAYSRTGNNIKELIYYSCSQETFMDNLNETLAENERYPIEINFYEDSEWLELQKLLRDFEPKNEL